MRPRRELNMWVILSCTFIISSYSVSTATEEFQELTRYTLLKDVVSSTGLIVSKPTQTTGQCILECYHHPSCILLGVSEQLGRCDLYEAILSGAEPFTVQASTDFYILLRDEPESHEPTQQGVAEIQTCSHPDYTHVSDLSLCVRISTNLATFDEARTTCQSEGGDIIMTKTQEVIDYLQANVSPGLSYWIGLKQTPGDLNSWFWLDNSPSTLDIWASSEPNVVSEECALVIKHAHTTLLAMDYPCGSPAAYICEIK